MKIKFFLISMFAIFSFSSFASIDWYKGDFPSALDKASSENKLLFIDFYATWCGSCKWIEKNIFPLENVSNFINENFIALKYDVDIEIHLTNKLRVEGVPTNIIFDPVKRDEVGRITDVSSSGEEFINKIVHILNN